MREDVKTEWVRRLRDGRPQITGYLHTSEGQCCLGVLTEYAAENGVVKKNESGSFFSYTDPKSGHVSDSCTPISVLEWAGLPTAGFSADIVDIKSRPNKHHDGRVTALAEANDDGYTFPEIAEIIEKEL